MIAYRSVVVRAPLRVHGLCTVWPLAQPARSPSAWRISRPRRDTFTLEAGLLALLRKACRTIKQADLVIRVVRRHRARGGRVRRKGAGEGMVATALCAFVGSAGVRTG